MRGKLALALAAAALLVTAALGRGQVREPGPTYQLWEYRTEITRTTGLEERSAEGTLNALGREGWELTAMSRREIRVQDTIQTETVLVFKRSRGEARR